LLAVNAPELVNRLILMSPAGTLARIAAQWLVRMFSATSMVSTGPFRREFLPPTKLTDDELRRISAPATVLLGDREVIYAGGPEAAIARAHRLIPNVHTRLLQGAGHVLTLDAPDVVVAEMTAR
jgi:pimeloyl-ACP methyl ester carboxylesterase